VFGPLAGGHDPYTGAALKAPYPAVVIVSGSIQSSAEFYLWLAQDLAERGYVVLTFDVQGQGASETLPHQGQLPSCCTGVPSEQAANFLDGTEDAIGFFLSASNPLAGLVDHSPDRATVTPGRTTRLAIIGHSTGAVTVSYLQGVDQRVETAVALDKLTATPASITEDGALLGSLPGPVRPVVPALALQAEYGFAPQPYWLADC
jgi:alpha-beta hydrolase superfamily lysophospholipase